MWKFDTINACQDHVIPRNLTKRTVALSTPSYPGFVGFFVGYVALAPWNCWLSCGRSEAHVVVTLLGDLSTIDVAQVCRVNTLN